jgi:hypothetical protein
MTWRNNRASQYSKFPTHTKSTLFLLDSFQKRDFIPQHLVQSEYVRLFRKHWDLFERFWNNLGINFFDQNLATNALITVKNNKHENRGRKLKK